MTTELITVTDLKKLKVCFVDNEKTERQSIEEDLRYLGNSGNWTVVDYSQLVTEKAIKEEYDILVCDFKMPDKNGIEVMEEIRDKNKNVILALYTAFAISPDSDEATRCDKASIERFKKFDGVGCLIGTLQNRYAELKTQLGTKYREKEDSTAFLSFIRKIFPPKQTTLEGIQSVIEKDNAAPAIEFLEGTARQLSTITQNAKEFEELKKIILELADEFIKDLEENKDDDVFFIHSEEGKITINELKIHVKNLSPLGAKHLRFWFKAQLRKRKKRK